MDDEPTVSPMARRAARERGIDLATLSGSGPGGKIVLSDVEDAVDGPPRGPDDAFASPQRTVPVEAPRAEPEPEPDPEREPEPDPRPSAEPEPEPEPAATVPPRVETTKGATETVEPTRLQGLVARRVAESRATVPDATYTVEVDGEALVGLREQLRAAAEPGDDVPTVTDLVVKACGLALRAHPKANGTYRDARYELHARVNIGVVVGTDVGMVAPVVLDADEKDLPTIAREIAALSRRAFEGETTQPDLAGATFTVSELGTYGIRRFAAVVSPPQAGVLAVGELAPRAVVRDGAVVARHVMDLTLACDHRILHPAEAAAFLNTVRSALQAPLKLVL